MSGVACTPRAPRIELDDAALEDAMTLPTIDQARSWRGLTLVATDDEPVGRSRPSTWTGRPGSPSGPCSTPACSAARARSCPWPTPPSRATPSRSRTSPRWSARPPGWSRTPSCPRRTRPACTPTTASSTRPRPQRAACRPARRPRPTPARRRPAPPPSCRPRPGSRPTCQPPARFRGRARRRRGRRPAPPGPKRRPAEQGRPGRAGDRRRPAVRLREHAGRAHGHPQGGPGRPAGGGEWPHGRT